jgi:hypothetical protein
VIFLIYNFGLDTSYPPSQLGRERSFSKDEEDYSTGENTCKGSICILCTGREKVAQMQALEYHNTNQGRKGNSKEPFYSNLELAQTAFKKCVMTDDEGGADAISSHTQQVCDVLFIPI